MQSILSARDLLAGACTLLPLLDARILWRAAGTIPTLFRTTPSPYPFLVRCAVPSHHYLRPRSKLLSRFPLDGMRRIRTSGCKWSLDAKVVLTIKGREVVGALRQRQLQRWCNPADEERTGMFRIRFR